MNIGIVLLSLQVMITCCSEHEPEQEVKSERSMQLLTKAKTDLFADGVPLSPVTPLVKVRTNDEEEQDKKIASAIDEGEVSEEESSLLWQLYHMATDCYEQHEPFSEDLFGQIRLAIEDNPRVLRSTRPIRYRGRGDYKPMVPLCAFAQFLHSPGSNTYFDAFFNMVDLDTNNDRRLKALEVIIDQGHMHSTKKLVTTKVLKTEVAGNRAQQTFFA